MIAELVAQVKPLIDKSGELADTVLVTDSLETLGAFAVRLRGALPAEEGPIATAQVEVVVTHREGLPDRVRLGPFDVIVDARAPPGQVFKLSLPPPPTVLPLLRSGATLARRP